MVSFFFLFDKFDFGYDIIVEINGVLFMNQRDTFRMMIGAYYGVLEMDEYNLKEYVLCDLMKAILEFVNHHKDESISYQEEANDIEKNVSLKTKLQDCLIVLPKLNVSMEFLFLIKEKLRNIDEMLGV